MKKTCAEVLSSRSVGEYQSLTLVAPEIAERARPGQFVQISMPPGSAAVLRRAFALQKASKQGGWAGTIEFAFDRRGPGTAWLSEVQPHGFLDVVGPLGKGFALPKDRGNCLLVADGHGAGQLYFLAESLSAMGKRVDMIVGGRTEDGVFNVVEAKRLSQSVAVATADGSLGERGGRHVRRGV